jgi:hypothetical protein
MDYRWQPDNCKLLTMDTKQLADHFIKHPLLFVGDSITQLQFESLGCLLGNHFPNKHPVKSTLNGGNGRIKISQAAPANMDTPTLGYIRSDYLLRLDDYKIATPFEKVGSQLGRGENWPWYVSQVHFFFGFFFPLAFFFLIYLLGFTHFQSLIILLSIQ